jgi:hypothetical protein
MGKILGKIRNLKVLENKLDLNSSQKISTIGLHNGIYFIQVTSLEFNSVTKWVKY